MQGRFQACGLELHPEKTKIVYCKGGYNKLNYSVVNFDFLGYTFGPKRIKTKKGQFGVYFVPRISQKKAKLIRQEINSWPWLKWIPQGLSKIKYYSRSRLLGWLNYYGVFGKTLIRNTLFHFDKRLSRWAKKKYKKLKSLMQAARWVNNLRKQKACSFPHW